MSFAAIEDFALERYFARWEFAVEHQLSASDVEGLPMSELLAMADADGRRRWDGLTLGYTESTGLPALRAEISRLYDHVDAEDVLVCAGAEEGIFLAMNATVTAGDHTIVVTPAYQSLHAIARSIGADVTCIELQMQNGWELDPDDVARAITSRTRAIVINYPHNPTGALLSHDVQQRLIGIADRAGATLLSDEVYRGLEYTNEHRLPAAADVSASAVSLGVMSKSFALAGLRIGWLASKNRQLLARVARLKDYTTICSSAPSEVLALIALRARDRILARSRRIVSENLTAAREFMSRQSDMVGWVEPRAGSVALPRFISRDADQIAEMLAEQHSTLMLPGSVFGAGRGHFRLGLGRTDFRHALGRLELVLSAR